MEKTSYPGTGALSCVEMHTTGEPARIIYNGFPKMQGTLLEQLAEGRNKYDHLRRRVMMEPRGHEAMYGAIIVQETEMAGSGEADIGVLFIHHGGFSTMCGHATLALGRFLVDTHDQNIFPNRQNLVFDPVSQVTNVRLHAPCGVLKLSVPTKPGGRTSDPSKPVSFISMESFATAVQAVVNVQQNYRWPELGSRENVTVDVSYGGTFHLIVSAKALGFRNGLKGIDVKSADLASKMLKATINENEDIRSQIFQSAPSPEKTFIYSVMIVDDTLGEMVSGTEGAETGLCFFDAQQIDRSPTGSCVQARVALAYAKGILKLDQSWTYNSIVSNAFDGSGAFVGKVKEIVSDEKKEILVEVSGQAYYTGVHTFTVEEEDLISKDGFDFLGMFAV